MTDNFDPYVALDLAYGVTDEEIKAQYRRLVKQYHPDHNSAPGSSDKMNKVIKAYRMLTDPIQKAEFDRKREKQLYGHYQKAQSSAFFNGLKSFASKLANDFIDDVSHDIQRESIDPNLHEMCDISSSNTRSYHKLTIRIPRAHLDVWRQDKEYWIDQLCAYIEQDLNRSI
jgi:DnaJ-class molecular chaperone